MTVIRMSTFARSSMALLLGGVGAWEAAGCFSGTVDGTRPSSAAQSTGSETDEGGAGTSTPTATTSDSGDTTSPETTETAETTETTETTGGIADSSEESGDPCTEAGCPCDAAAVAAPCDDGLSCSNGVCTAPECGDGAVDDAEQCDDGNGEDGDGCDNDCSYTEIQIDAGGNHTCALIEGGRVRCWGDNRAGELGYGNTQNVGDNEFPWEAGDVQLPVGVSAIRSGGSHVCARTENPGDVICWGSGTRGALGTGNQIDVGDDELPSMLSPISLGADTSLLSTGNSHSCILDTAGRVRCWGAAFQGQLGYGNEEDIGDNELPEVAGTVDIGATASQLTTGVSHTCVVLSDGRVRCWGSNNGGQLGLGSLATIGDDERPDTTTPLNFGVDAVKVAAGQSFTCALFENGTVRCWGQGSLGKLGRGDGSDDSIGDDEPVINVEPVDLGGALAVDISAGANHTCVLLDTHEVLCWGRNSSGEVGNGETDPVGDDETPGEVGPVALDGDVIQLDCGSAHVCVVLEDYRVRCWGEVGFGRLGLGPSVQGDVSAPLSVSPVQVLEPR